MNKRNYSKTVGILLLILIISGTIMGLKYYYSRNEVSVINYISHITYNDNTNTLDKIIENRLVTIGDRKNNIEYTILNDNKLIVTAKNSKIKYNVQLSKETMSMIRDLLDRESYKEICRDLEEYNYYISYKDNNKIYYCTVNNLDDDSKFKRNYNMIMELIKKEMSAKV